MKLVKEYLIPSCGLFCAGNTMTLSMTRSVLETGRAIGGQSIREHNEIIGMDAALHFLNGTMLGIENPLDVQTILDIHTKLLG